MVEITDKPISPDSLVAGLHKAEHGAVVTFTGVVRTPSRGKDVRSIEYEAFTELARKRLQQIVDEIREKWQLQDVGISHRVGRVKKGEAAVVIVVAAGHRKEAFAACEYAIDRIKEIVPIWKKEIYSDGEVWVSEGH